jgi:hypothetical protein
MNTDKNWRSNLEKSFEHHMILVEEIEFLRNKIKEDVLLIKKLKKKLKK